MRCFAVNIFECSDKMEFGKICLIRNIIQINFFGIVSINKSFRLNQSSCINIFLDTARLAFSETFILF